MSIRPLDIKRAFFFFLALSLAATANYLGTHDARTKLMQASPPLSRFTHFALPTTSLEENWEPRRRRPDHLPLSWSLSNWYIPTRRRRRRRRRAIYLPRHHVVCPEDTPLTQEGLWRKRRRSTDCAKGKKVFHFASLHSPWGERCRWRRPSFSHPLEMKIPSVSKGGDRQALKGLRKHISGCDDKKWENGDEATWRISRRLAGSNPPSSNLQKAFFSR